VNGRGGEGYSGGSNVVMPVRYWIVGSAGLMRMTKSRCSWGRGSRL
jgi:hypothetical protein